MRILNLGVPPRKGPNQNNPKINLKLLPPFLLALWFSTLKYQQTTKGHTLKGSPYHERESLKRANRKMATQSKQDFCRKKKSYRTDQYLQREREEWWYSHETEQNLDGLGDTAQGTSQHAE